MAKAKSSLAEEVKAVREPKPSDFYQMHASYHGRPPCFRLANSEDLQKDGNGLCAKSAWPDGFGKLPRHPSRFPDYLETPRFLFDKKIGRPSKDLEAQDNFWVVSPAMKGFLERIDPHACEFRKCDTIWASGESGPECWLCSITRYVYGRDVIDFEASSGLRTDGTTTGLPSYYLSPATRLFFKPEALGGAQLFRVVELGSRIYCTQRLKKACKAAALKGPEFKQSIKL